MSEGFALPQNRQQMSALRARLAKLAEGGGTFQEHSQAGALLSSLADAAWWLGGQDWRCDAGRLVNSAMDQLEKAYVLLPSDNVVASTQLMGEEAMVRVRAYRMSHVARYVTSAKALLEDARLQLSTHMGYAPSDNPAAWHQMAVCTSQLSQITWGSVLGYGPKGGEKQASMLAAEATKYFQGEQELTPDGELAYRSHLMTLALTYHEAGDKATGRAYARLAMASAMKHHDWPQYRRALVIMTAGRFGDRQARILQEAKAVRTLP